VRFVDGDEGGPAAGEHLGKARDAETLRSNEEELDGAVEISAAGLAGIVAGVAGVDAGDAEAVGGKLGGLVFHEGNEGADDEGGAEGAGAGAGNGGELIAEALAGAGGHDEEDVAALGEGAADGFLIFAEGWEAEGGVEEREEIHGANFMFPQGTGRVVVLVQHREHRGHRGPIGTGR
jgi:hypothetical protein